MSKRKQGELEAEILSCLWDRPDGLTSMQILAMVGDENLAITTVLTVLSRLVDKELVQRESLGGRTILFRAAKSREHHTASLLLEALQNTQNPALVFSHFTSGLTAQHIESLKRALNQ